MSTVAQIAGFGGRLSIRRCAAAGAIVLGVLFLLCWISAAISWLNVSHMFVAIFTNDLLGSTAALCIGLFWSILFGGLSGALTALAYNALAFLER